MLDYTGDQLWQRGPTKAPQLVWGTICSAANGPGGPAGAAINGLGGPSVAAINGLGGPAVAAINGLGGPAVAAINGPGDQFWGTSCSMTGNTCHVCPKQKSTKSAWRCTVSKDTMKV